MFMYFSSSEQELALKAGLPTYKCVVHLRKKEDRQKLKATACAECSKVRTTNTKYRPIFHG